jgi:hypothetical protein
MTKSQLQEGEIHVEQKKREWSLSSAMVSPF